MADDPYKLLGLGQNAADADIRRAFRRLAKELHPDVRPDDNASAERFKKITAAYDLLSDPEKRARFDRGEIEASGEPRRGRQWAGGAAGGQPAGSSGDPGFGDIFADIFSNRGHRGPGAGFAIKGQDVRYTLEVEFLESVLGAKKRVTMPEGASLDLSVPEGVTDGQVLRLKGKGSPGFRGGEQGDALVEIRVRPHAQFRRQGDDILIELPVAIDEAILGARIEVPTTSGRVALTIPAGTSSGQAFRLKGKGVRGTPTRPAGDQIVTTKIVLPPTIDESLAYFIAEWKKKHSYDPGRGTA